MKRFLNDNFLTSCQKEEREIERERENKKKKYVARKEKRDS